MPELVFIGIAIPVLAVGATVPFATPRLAYMGLAVIGGVGFGLLLAVSESLDHGSALRFPAGVLGAALFTLGTVLAVQRGGGFENLAYFPQYLMTAFFGVGTVGVARQARRRARLTAGRAAKRA